MRLVEKNSKFPDSNIRHYSEMLCGESDLWGQDEGSKCALYWHREKSAKCNDNLATAIVLANEVLDEII